MSASLATPADILSFWFGPDRIGAWAATPETMRQWFVKDLDFDAAIVARFGTTIEAALDGDTRLSDWDASPDGALALLILLDQFTRNTFRGTGRMFVGDPKALALATRLVDNGVEKSLRPIERVFVYLPFEHSESLRDQERAIALFEALAAGEPDGTFATMSVDYARKHEVIIRRFGRFPHRNALLGRESTEEELAFLATPGSSF